MTTTVLGKVMLLPRGDYSPSATYNFLDLVTYEGSSFVALKTVTGVTPIDDGVNYQLSASKGEDTSIYGLDTGTANAYAATFAPAVTALTDGLAVRFKAANANTGASTFAPNGLPAKAVLGGAQVPLQGGEIVADGQVGLVYNATLDAWTIDAQSGGALQIADATQSAQAISQGQLSQNNGATLVGYQAPGTGSVARTQAAKNAEHITPEDKGAIGDGVADDTAAVQAAWAQCESTILGGGKELYLPGRYKTTSSIVCTKPYIRVRGSGQNFSGLIPTGGSFAAITTATMGYLSPVFSDFAISGGTPTGHTGKGIDLTNITLQVYQGALSRLNIKSGDICIDAPNFFSMHLNTILGYSYSGHTFRVHCGPAVSWVNCYAATCGTGKAGYRLAGAINMNECNGLNSGDWWGVFGCNTAAGDSWASDFATNDYPSVNVQGCNIEQFTTGGIFCHSAFKQYTINHTKVDRSGLTSDYDSLFRFYGSSANVFNGFHAAAKIGLDSYFSGTGVPNAGLGLTNAWVYVATGGNVGVMDTSGTLAANVPGVSMGNYGNSIVPFVNTGYYVNDVYQDAALYLNAVSPRRLSVNMIRYVTPAALTPVGAAQAIVVTGYTKVTVTPASAASISTATFSIALGVGADYGRNGDLLIEAGNANLTINHSASGAYTFRMKSGANATLAAGEIRHFVFSVTSNLWVEV